MIGLRFDWGASCDQLIGRLTSGSIRLRSAGSLRDGAGAGGRECGRASKWSSGAGAAGRGGEPLTAGASCARAQCASRAGEREQQVAGAGPGTSWAPSSDHLRAAAI